MRPILVLALALVIGCKPTANSRLPAADREPSQTIKGAFGWVLGEKIPVGLELHRGDFWDEDYAKTAPFVNVVVCGLEDRTIYEISAGTTDAELLAIRSSLEQKYGPEQVQKSGDDYVHFWSNGSRVIHLDTLSNEVFLKYVDLKLQAQWVKEMESQIGADGARLAPKL